MENKNDRIKYFAKHFFNPITLKFAGARFSPFASLRHVGRKSGKPYATPLVVRQTRKGFIIALPYGPEVDWYRNMTAAEHSSLRNKGREYELAKPVAIGAEQGLPEFPLTARFMLRRFGVKDFALVPARSSK